MPVSWFNQEKSTKQGEAFSFATMDNIREKTLYLVSGSLALVGFTHAILTQGLAPGLTQARIAGLIAVGFFCLCPVSSLVSSSSTQLSSGPPLHAKCLETPAIDLTEMHLTHWKTFTTQSYLTGVQGHRTS